jgi:hypothetical protein
MPITNTSGLSDTVSFTWDDPGTQAITVTASNFYGSTSEYFTLPVLMPPLFVEISGPIKGDIQGSTSFTATVSPITTTVPLNYEWYLDDQLVYTHPSGLSDTATFSWSQPRLHEISVLASNPVGSVNDSWSVTIYFRVYLPTV